MDNFKNFLRLVGKKPGFYLSPDRNGNCKSIRHLRTFLTGMQVGRRVQYDENVLDAFTFWVCCRYRVPMGGLDWSGHILNHVERDEAAAFELFFELLEEYLPERERIGYEEIKARYLTMEQTR